MQTSTTDVLGYIDNWEFEQQENVSGELISAPRGFTLSAGNIPCGVRDLHRRRADGALYRRCLRSEARGLAQVGKYRSTSYVWRQSHHNLRSCQVRGLLRNPTRAQFVRHRVPVNFLSSVKVRERNRRLSQTIFSHCHPASRTLYPIEELFPWNFSTFLRVFHKRRMRI